MNGVRVGITHRKIDLDAGSCIRFLQILGEVDEIEFGVDKAEEYEGKADKIIFVDTYPLEEPREGKVEIYSQHLIEKVLDEEQLKAMQVSSFELLTSAKGIEGFDKERMERWETLVRYGDFFKDSGEMDIKRALGIINSFLDFPDREVYERWFVPLMDSFLSNDKDLERGQKIFNETVSDFLLSNPDSIAKNSLNNWLEKIKEPEKLDALRNIFHLLCYMEEDVGREWLLMIFKALERSQEDFQKAINSKELFESIKVDYGGRFVIVSQITNIRSFSSALRYLTRTRSELLPETLIKSTIDERRPYIIILVNPETLNFYISSGVSWEYGDWKQRQTQIKMVQGIFSELVKAVRAEILIRKDIPINDWLAEVLTERKKEMGYLFKLEKILRKTKPRLANILKQEAVRRLQEHKRNIPQPRVLLSQPCDIALTRPLFFNKKEYPQILWGSATHPEPPADIFGKTAEDIRRELVEIAKLSVDNNYFPPYCDPKNCLGCPLELWYLNKCLSKRGKAD